MTFSWQNTKLSWIRCTSSTSFRSSTVLLRVRKCFAILAFTVPYNRCLTATSKTIPRLDSGLSRCDGRKRRGRSTHSPRRHLRTHWREPPTAISQEGIRSEGKRSLNARVVHALLQHQTAGAVETMNPPD